MPKPRSVRQLSALLGAAGLLAAGGCGRVDRQMQVQSNPAGALVYLNGEEVGRTPCTVDFTWYGRYDVTLRKEGYETLKTTQTVVAPWWQWIPLDLLADLTPGRKVDTHHYSFAMKACPDAQIPGEIMLQRSGRLKSQLESGEFTRPTTRSSATASTQPADDAE